MAEIIATRRLPGDAWDALGEVELVRLAELDAPRPGVRVLVEVVERVDDSRLDLLPDLELVANYGVGYDSVDVAACARRGVAVTNTPGVLDAATADLAFALVLAVRRRVVEADRIVRSGGWNSNWASPVVLADEVTGATIGIVGFGRIGQAVARRARGFEMRVLYARRGDGHSELGERRELDDLLRESDVVSLPVPLNDETRGLLSRERLALLRDGATLVNTARGGVVDEEALVDELRSGRIRAGLDVFAHEPQVPAELLELPNVVLLPHVGSATAETRGAMTRVLVENVLAHLRGERPPNAVTA